MADIPLFRPGHQRHATTTRTVPVALPPHSEAGMNCDAVARPQVDELGGSRSPAAGYPGKRPRTWIALQTLRRVGAGGYPRHARV